MKHVVIRVNGTVQGVFFRASAKETAEQLGVKGFTMNRPDGTVYIEAEGDEEALTRFVTWCKQGPPRAHVTQVDVQEGTLKNFSAFEVRR